jgi:hypothetical protein
MTAHFTPPPSADLLSQAIDFLRPQLDRAQPIGERLRILWAGVLAARDLGATDLIEAEFGALALDTGIHADLGRHADEDIRHVIRWAMLGQNPFA